MKTISKDNYRILELFREFLVCHRNLPHVDVFMNKLEDYSIALGKIDRDLGQKIYGYWRDMEQIYAWYLSEERLDPNNSERKNMLKIYDEILMHCEKALKKYAVEPEDPYAWPFEEYK